MEDGDGMKRIEIVDLETLRKVCYDYTEEEVLDLYKKMNGYHLLEKDFKSLTIQELNEFLDELKIYEEFLNVLCDVFEFEKIPFSAKKYSKEILQELKNKEINLKEEKKNFSIENNIDLSIPFYRLTYDVIESLPHKDPRKENFRKVMRYINRKIPKDFTSNMTDKDFTIEKLLKEIADYKRIKKR